MPPAVANRCSRESVITRQYRQIISTCRYAARQNILRTCYRRHQIGTWQQSIAGGKNGVCTGRQIRSTDQVYTGTCKIAKSARCHGIVRRQRIVQTRQDGEAVAGIGRRQNIL